MCLAIPARVTELLDEGHANVDYGDGVKRKINISLVDVKIGDYVLVHAGFAIQVLDEEEAKETLRLFERIARGMENV